MLPGFALTLTAETASAPLATLAERCRAAAARDIAGIELFTPHPDWASVPFFDDGPPPAAILEVQGDHPETLLALAQPAAFGAAAGLRAGLFRILRESLPGETEPQPRTAAMSFVVRYYGPTADPVHFAAHYVANHPPILARFPRIRNVLCYVPVGDAVPGFEPDPCIIRNEVVFDSVRDLVAALHSPVLAELRADSKTFAKFGRSTHHAMVRERLH